MKIVMEVDGAARQVDSDSFVGTRKMPSGGESDEKLPMWMMAEVMVL
jgi:hypothetical protein